MHKQQLQFLALILFLLISCVSCTHTPNAMLPVYTQQAETLMANLEETALASITENVETDTMIINSNDTSSMEIPMSMEIPSDTSFEMGLATVTPVALPTVLKGASSGSNAIVSVAAIPTVTGAAVSQVAGDAAVLQSFSPINNSTFSAGQTFYLTVKIQNTGTTSWSTIYYLENYDGTQLTVEKRYPLSLEVAPGSTYTHSFYMTVPTTSGNYTSKWYLGDAVGNVVMYFNYDLIVGDFSVVTSIASLTPSATAVWTDPNMTPTPRGGAWMCIDQERSRIIGSTCVEFCAINATPFAAQGNSCYVRGELYNGSQTE